MAKNQKDIDTLASARSLYEPGSQQYNRIQNSINKLSGVKKRHDTKNAPTNEQMKIAKKGRQEIMAGMSPIAKTASMVLMGNTDKEIEKALKGIKTSTPKVTVRKTKHSGTMMGGL